MKFLKLWDLSGYSKEQCPRGLLAKNEHFGANCLWDRSPVMLRNSSKFFWVDPFLWRRHYSNLQAGNWRRRERREIRRTRSRWVESRPAPLMYQLVRLIIKAPVNSSFSQHPSPRATAGHFPTLSVPGMEHLQIVCCPGLGYFQTSGPFPSFWHARGFLSE